MGIIAAITFSCTNDQPQSQTNEEVEKELLRAIEERFYAWRDNDEEAFLKTYHPDWKRWGMNEDKLHTVDQIGGFWDDMKSKEESMEMEIKLVDYDLLGDGSVALVHYEAIEKFKWIGPENEMGWKPGDIYKGNLRWSDVMVKENGKWLCIGGHRDLSKPERFPEKLN